MKAKSIKLTCNVSLMTNEDGFQRFTVAFDSDDIDASFSIGYASGAELGKTAGQALSNALAVIALREKS